MKREERAISRASAGREVSQTRTCTCPVEGCGNPLALTAVPGRPGRLVGVCYCFRFQFRPVIETDALPIETASGAASAPAEHEIRAESAQDLGGLT